MDIYDLSHKLAFAGRHSAVPFTTGPEYTNSIPGVPVLSALRVFVAPDLWSDENIQAIAREIYRVLGPTEQFDIGITLARKNEYSPNAPAFGLTARLTKLNPKDPRVVLRMSDGNGDRLFVARYPRLEFEPAGEDFWDSHYAPGAVKLASQP
jgi:hypothetical protein